MFVTQFVPVQKTTDVTATFKGEKALALENDGCVHSYSCSYRYRYRYSHSYGDSSSYILL